MAKQILEKYKKLVWPKIDKCLQDPNYPEDFKVPKVYASMAKYHWKVVREYPERKGKYLRPTLLILSALAMGVRLEDTLDTAAAMQISEDWILAHDDLEDDSLERRGKPTLHRIYGPELTINAGDALQIVMWRLLNDNFLKLDKKTAYAISEEFFKMLTRTALGQNTECVWAKENKTKFSDKDWYFIGDGKSGYYTIAGPLRLGGILAGASEKQLDLLAKFGSSLGRCFQLTDDLLDLTSDFAGFKKQIGNDIYEGKKTVMLGHLLRTANAKDKKKLLAIMAKSRSEKTATEIGWVIERMRYYKSLEYGKKLAKEYRDKALKIFNRDLGFLSHEPARSDLIKITNFILERNH